MINTIDVRIKRELDKYRLAFRGVINLVKAAGSIQFVQLEGLKDEPLLAEQFQEYGFTSNMPPGGMAVILPLGGKTAHGIVIATEHGSYRLKGLKSGEVALYSDEGDSVILKRGRLMEATTGTFRINAMTAIEFNAPAVTTNAQTVTANAAVAVQLNTPGVMESAAITAGTDITDSAATLPKTMSGMRSVFNGHTQNDPQGGVVGTPNQQM